MNDGGVRKLLRFVLAKSHRGILLSVVVACFVGLSLVVPRAPRVEHESYHQYEPSDADSEPSQGVAPNRDEKSHGRSEEQQEQVESGWYEFVEFFEKHDKFVVAICTVVIALFTVALFITSYLLWISAKRHSERELRAYLSLLPGQIAFNGLIPLWVENRLKNHGATPASEVVRFVSLHYLPYPLPADFDPGTPGAGESTQGMWPQSELPAKRPLGKAIPTQILADLVSGNRRIFLFGLVRYRDVYGKRHYTKLCASLDWQQVNEFMFKGAKAGSVPHGPRVMEVVWDIDSKHNDFD